MNNKKKNKQSVEDFSTEFEEKVLFINRCAKVLKGGRKFSFSALILVGDNEGHIGYGFAKANELADSIRKGAESAKRDILTVKMKNSTIPHEIVVRWDGAVLLLKPAPEGTGIIAGSKVRAILELAGIKDIVAKSLGCNNPINLVHATFKALRELRSKEDCLQMRGVA
ncbi:MAG: 30S ribosomal protein S5 [Chlamydiae bacterium]|nr:30S ribosomal protein S5 [Chlamydiota bacterium]